MPNFAYLRRTSAISKGRFTAHIPNVMDASIKFHLAEAKHLLAEAKSGVPEAKGRLGEAKSRLVEQTD